MLHLKITSIGSINIKGRSKIATKAGLLDYRNYSFHNAIRWEIILEFGECNMAPNVTSQIKSVYLRKVRLCLVHRLLVPFKNILILSHLFCCYKRQHFIYYYSKNYKNSLSLVSSYIRE